MELLFVDANQGEFELDYPDEIEEHDLLASSHRYVVEMERERERERNGFCFFKGRVEQ